MEEAKKDQSAEKSVPHVAKGKLANTQDGQKCPVYLLAIIVVSAFVIEMFVVFLLNMLSPLPVWGEVLTGAGFLLILLFPVLYFLVFRSMVTQINERKAVEEKLKQSTEQLKKSNEKLERTTEELKQFAYVASHDLQEPIRMVVSYTQLLSRRYQGKLDDNADEFINFAVDGANRMQGLINDLLTYSRVNTRGKEPEPTDCKVVLDKTLANLQVSIRKTGAVITHNGLPAVTVDSRQLSQLFRNLIGNAIKFSGEEQPKIHISAEQKEQEWVFSVHDDGIGIEPQYADRVFIIFQCLHTRSEYSGNGIGLAVCKRIVERHGGHIWMESEFGKGTTFYFTIPIQGE